MTLIERPNLDEVRERARAVVTARQVVTDKKPGRKSKRRPVKEVIEEAIVDEVVDEAIEEAVVDEIAAQRAKEEVRWAVRITNRHTGEAITLGMRYDTRQEAEAASTDEHVCHRCNRVDVRLAGPYQPVREQRRRRY